ncbi:MAG: hypothetical protein QOI06_3343 [Nocardioidaceae bacterium]|jgi:hypothetical protein|nr:hypothetical protein [Nocardioidaceae bacterium]
MIVLWWLAPPLAATCLAMVWAAWAGRDRDEVKRDDSDAAMARMKRAIERPTPHRGRPVASVPVEPTHGVAIRGLSRRREPDSPASR